MDNVIIVGRVKVFKHNSGKLSGRHCAVRLCSDELKRYYGKHVELIVREIIK